MQLQSGRFDKTSNRDTRTRAALPDEQVRRLEIGQVQMLCAHERIDHAFHAKRNHIRFEQTRYRDRA
ncbi:hypothetical protein QFZ97_004914 [Paraburkholderia youngii]